MLALRRQDVREKEPVAMAREPDARGDARRRDCRRRAPRRGAQDRDVVVTVADFSYRAHDRLDRRSRACRGAPPRMARRRSPTRTCGMRLRDRCRVGLGPDIDGRVGKCGVERRCERRREDEIAEVVERDHEDAVRFRDARDDHVSCRGVTINVLHVDTERGWRGGERQTLWLARELMRRGYGSIVAARAREPLAQRATGEGLDVVECNPRSEIAVLAAATMRSVIRRPEDRSRARTHGDMPSPSRRSRHGNWSAIRGCTTRGFQVARQLRHAPQVRRAAKFIAVSEAVARVLESSGVDA